MLALHPELSPDTDAPRLCEIAVNYAPFWDIANGMTLLRQEHINLHEASGTEDEDE